MINNNLIQINFTPQESGFYFINVLNGDQPIEGISRIYVNIKFNLKYSLGSPFTVRVERPQVVQISGKCFHQLRLNDLGIFRIHCNGQRGPMKAKICSKIHRLLSFKCNYFSCQIFL